MKTKNRKDKKLKKLYAKSFKQLNKKFLFDNDKTACLKSFVECLKYFRDLLLLKTVIDTEATRLVLATLNTAIAEFEAYNDAETEKQKNFHWDNFCSFLNSNMEEWLEFNDSI